MDEPLCPHCRLVRLVATFDTAEAAAALEVLVDADLVVRFDNGHVVKVAEVTLE